MFEPEINKDAEQTRSRTIIWVSAGGLLLVIGVIMVLVLIKPENSPVLPRVVRAGTSEFDAYKDKVQLEVVDRIVHPNMIGMFQMEAKARVVNTGDRALSGVEVRGKILDLGEKVVADGVSVPIPRIRSAPLKPGEELFFSVKVDAPGKITEDDVKDIVIELYGLQFQ